MNNFDQFIQKYLIEAVPFFCETTYIEYVNSTLNLLRLLQEPGVVGGGGSLGVCIEEIL